MANPLPRLALKLIAPILLTGIFSFQYFFDKEAEKRFMPPTVIPVQAVKLADLGLHSAASAMTWIYTIQYIPHKMPELIKTVNDLDPKFSYPYAFAALVLPPYGFKAEAIEIAERGIREADPDWRIPYYLATSYHIHLQDRKNAAYYFGVAANMPDAPENIRSIAARYGTAGSQLEQSKQIWISIYENTDDEVILERAKNQITHIEMVEILEKAILLYGQRYGTAPSTIEDLVNGKILKSIPLSPLNVRFSISEGRLFIGSF